MGDRVLIYDQGQVYEIDADLIYVPTFVKEENKNGKEKHDTGIQRV